MANYYEVSRTNYFHVTDEDRLMKILNSAVTSDDGITVIPCVERDGDKTYMFYCEGTLYGLRSDWEENPDEGYDEDAEYDVFAEELQKVVAPGDAIMITTIGREAMRYLVACGDIITSDKYEHICMSDELRNKARTMLNDPNFSTREDY